MEKERIFKKSFSHLAALAANVIVVLFLVPVHAQVGDENQDKTTGLASPFSEKEPKSLDKQQVQPPPQAAQEKKLPAKNETPRSGSALFDALISTMNDKQTEALLTAITKNLDDKIKGLKPEDFDISKIARSIGSDPKALAAWVHENIMLVPYHGSLKGAQGSLNDRHANSLDRALLLSAMLKVHGIKSRLGRGKLVEKEARKLLHEHEGLYFEKLSGIHPPIADSLAKKIAVDVGLDEATVKAALNELETNHADTMKFARDVFQKISPPLVAAANGVKAQSDKELIKFEATRNLEALRDHWVIEIDQSGQSTRLLLDETDRALTTDEFYPSDALPDSLHHRIRIAIKVSFDKQLPEEVVAIEVPATKFFASNPKISILPVDSVSSTTVLDASAPIDLAYRTLARYASEELAEKQIMKENPLWLPIFALGNSKFTYDKAIDLSGELIDGTTLTKRASTIGNKVEAAGSLLFSMGVEPKTDPKEAKQSETFLIWLEVQTISPDGETNTSRRVWAHKTPETDLSSQPVSFLVDMARLMQLDISTGRPSAPHLNIQYLQSVRSMISKASGANDDIIKGRESYFLAYDLNRWLAIRERSSAYLERPNVTGLQIGFKDNGIAAITFDIMQNDVAVISNQAVSSYKERIEQGIADTTAEMILIDARAQESHTTNAALELFGLMKSSDSDFVLASDEDVNYLHWTNQTVNSDVTALVVTGQSDDTQAVHYWVFDPKTGNIVGRDAYGRGAAYAEYITLVARVGGCGYAAYKAGEKFRDKETSIGAKRLLMLSQDAALGCIGASLVAFASVGIAANIATNSAALANLFVVTSGIAGASASNIPPVVPTVPVKERFTPTNKQLRDELETAERENQDRIETLERESQERIETLEAEARNNQERIEEVETLVQDLMDVVLPISNPMSSSDDSSESEN